MGELGTVNVNATVDINQDTLTKLWIGGASLIVLAVVGAVILSLFKKI